MNRVPGPRELDARLSGFRGREAELRAREQQAEAALASAQRGVAEIRRERAAVQRQIEDLEARRQEPTVTDHALVRYLERVLGIDVDAARRAILTDRLREQIATVGSGLIPAGDFRVRVRNGAVVTVLTADADRD